MQPILENYIAMANLIVETFGDHSEVILHDFSQPKNSVVYTCNNVVTRREIGQSFTEYFVKEVLLSRKFNNDLSANYMMEGEDGKKIKSSTALIRDGNGKVIGALCVNIDITDMKRVFSQFMSMIGMREETILPASDEVTVMPNIREIVDDIIDMTIGSQDVATMSRDQKVDLIRFMNDKGLFLIKGTMEKVAERMGISRVTIYGYLDEIKKSEKKTEE